MNFEEAKKYATKTFLKRGHALPTFVGEDAGGKRHMLVTPWPNDRAKIEFLNLVRLYFIAYDIRSYAFVCETWMSSYAGSVPPDRPEPSKDPNRVETLMVVACPEKVYTLYPIVRDGEKVSLGESRDADSGTGRMMELLPPLRPTEDQRTIAKDLFAIMAGAMRVEPRVMKKDGVWH